MKTASRTRVCRLCPKFEWSKSAAQQLGDRRETTYMKKFGAKPTVRCLHVARRSGYFVLLWRGDVKVVPIQPSPSSSSSDERFERKTNQRRNLPHNRDGNSMH